MRKTLGVCLLVLLLTGSASAGIMPNDTPAPPPPPATAEPETAGDATLQGEIPNPPGLSESLTQTALDLLAVLF